MDEGVERENCEDEVRELRESRDWWIGRAQHHATEADRLRVEVINLKGRLYLQERGSSD